MNLDELEGDDEAIRRLQAMDEVNPLFRKARAKRMAYERLLADRLFTMLPLQHPFEHDPKRPTLHP